MKKKEWKKCLRFGIDWYLVSGIPTHIIPLMRRVPFFLFSGHLISLLLYSFTIYGILLCRQRGYIVFMDMLWMEMSSSGLDYSIFIIGQRQREDVRWNYTVLSIWEYFRFVLFIFASALFWLDYCENSVLIFLVQIQIQ